MGTTFKEYETRERKFMDWYINLKPEHKMEEESEIGSFKRNDFIMMSGNSYVMGEVKVRTFNHDRGNKMKAMVNYKIEDAIVLDY